MILLLVFAAVIFPQKDESQTIFMVGNSTMADKPYKNGNPEKGWAQVFPLYFKEGIKIENHAKNGRSTKSFLTEGRWAAVLYKMRTGDYVIIEFGHNDSRKDNPERYAEANTDYRLNLIKMIEEARSKGGIPVLATPIVRRRFDKNGIFYDTHGDYPKVVRELAAEYKVPLLDLHKKTTELLIQYGEKRSEQLFLIIKPGEYKSLPEGKDDNTHLSANGAFKVCDLAVEEIREAVPELAAWLKD